VDQPRVTNRHGDVDDGGPRGSITTVILYSSLRRSHHTRSLIALQDL